MNEIFKDVVQEVLEAEMDDHLGYDKYDVSEKKIANSRMDIKKSIKKSLLFIAANVWDILTIVCHHDIILSK